ncbi:uncharacterized protein METZ01_LOCUS297664, partial [marine metagenome]
MILIKANHSTYKKQNLSSNKQGWCFQELDY